MTPTYFDMESRLHKHLKELEVPYETGRLGTFFPDAPFEISSNLITYIPSLGCFFRVGGAGVASYPENYFKYSTESEASKLLEKDRILNLWSVLRKVHFFALDVREYDLMEDLVDVFLRHMSNDDMGEWMCELAYVRGYEL